MGSITDHTFLSLLPLSTFANDILSGRPVYATPSPLLHPLSTRMSTRVPIYYPRREGRQPDTDMKCQEILHSKSGGVSRIRVGVSERERNTRRGRWLKVLLTKSNPGNKDVVGI